MKSIIVKSLSLIFLIFPLLSRADNGICSAVGGVHVFTYNASYDITDMSMNAAGASITDAFKYELSGDYRAKCNAMGWPRLYFEGGSDLPVYRTIGDITWYKVNDYLAVSMKGYVAGNVGKYFKVPFTQSNECSSSRCSISATSSGSRGTVSLMVIKPFVGISEFNSIISYTKGATNTGVLPGAPHMSEVVMGGQVTVPQSCELDAGTTVTMDFGNIGAPLFSQAGAGNKPAGVNPKTHNIAVKCKNIDAQVLLSMRLESDNVSGNAMVSDNKDVGFVVADGSRNPLIPNNIDSKIKFHLDDNSAAMVPITAWPVSITGNKPAEGRFTAEGYLRVDFD